MSDELIAPMRSWLAGPMGADVSEAIERLRRATDVQRVAVMPDVHLSADVCIGVAVATSSLIYPQAVGGDIGCGMLAVATDVDHTALDNPRAAGQVLSELSRAVPARRRNRRETVSQPDDLAGTTLSHTGIESVRQNDGVLEFATLGSGNHFIEIQADEDGRLWLMIHSGSRALGQAIRDHHLSHAGSVSNRLRALDAKSDAGAEYLHDASYARRYAQASRRAIAEELGGVLARTLRCAYLLGNNYHDGSQPCLARNLRRARLLGAPKRRYVGSTWRTWCPAGINGQRQLSCGRAWERGGALLECSRRRQGVKPDSRSRQSFGTRTPPADDRNLVRLAPNRATS
jgi:hypothetical protein